MHLHTQHTTHSTTYNTHIQYTAQHTTLMQYNTQHTYTIHNTHTTHTTHNTHIQYTTHTQHTYNTQHTYTIHNTHTTHIHNTRHTQYARTCTKAVSTCKGRLMTGLCNTLSIYTKFLGKHLAKLKYQSNASIPLETSLMKLHRVMRILRSLPR